MCLPTLTTKIFPLLLFRSSHDPEKTDIEDYVARMKPEQGQNLYLAGESRAIIENSPHIEGVREKYEVLYMVESVDELVKPLIEILQNALGDHVRQVRLSTPFAASPVCLVTEDHECSPVLERALHRGNGRPGVKRVLEFNPRNALVSRVQQRLATNPEDAFLPNAAQVLFGLALLSEGSELTDPVRFRQAVAEVLNRAI